MNSAACIAARVRMLVERHDGGDIRAAAARLGVPTVVLEDMLTGEWSRMRADVLAAVVRTYGVAVDWLISFTAPDTTDIRIERLGGRERRRRSDDLMELL